MSYSLVFETAMDFLREWEGIDSNHPNDRGGRTRYGISQAAHPDINVPSLTWEQAVEIYHRDYWNGSGAFKSPPDAAFALFDSAVQHGVIQAIRLLQRAVRVGDDGVYGPRTEAAVQGCEKPGLELLAQRALLYHHILENDHTQSVFATGWMRRLIHATAVTTRLEVSR